MSKVLFIVGSLRKGSFNQQFAEIAAKELEGKAEVSFLDWSKVPVFNQDLETPVLPEIAAVREQVQAADAVWVVSPVYNFSIPGPVKNVLDWLSRALDLSDPTGPSAINGKVTTVSLVANGGHDQAAEVYRNLLPFIRTNFVDQVTSSRINDSAWVDGKFEITDEVAAQLKKQAEALLAAIN